MTNCCAGAVLGSACGIAAWLAYARLGFGEVTIETTGVLSALPCQLSALSKSLQV